MFARTILLAVPFIWAGMVLAVSFMEAPLKFQAPGITLALGLGIGRLVFFALNKMELACAALIFLAMYFTGIPSRRIVIFFGVVLVILLLDTFVILPMLDARAVEVVAGNVQPFSNGHLVYGGLELLKLGFLFALGITTARHFLVAPPQ